MNNRQTVTEQRTNIDVDVDLCGGGGGGGGEARNVCDLIYQGRYQCAL